jgi:hypothetical protein
MDSNQLEKLWEQIGQIPKHDQRLQALESKMDDVLGFVNWLRGARWVVAGVAIVAIATIKFWFRALGDFLVHQIRARLLG